MHTVRTHHSQIGKRPGVLDVLQRLLQVAELLVDDALGLLGALEGLRLKRLDGLDLPAHVVRLGLEGAKLLLDVVDDGLVLEDAAVVLEVDRLRLLREDRHFAARIVVALLEGLQGGGRVAFEAQLRAELGPVELEGGASLWAVSRPSLNLRLPLRVRGPRGDGN
jgi:hypothetical protein